MSEFLRECGEEIGGKGRGAGDVGIGVLAEGAKGGGEAGIDAC